MAHPEALLEIPEGRPPEAPGGLGKISTDFGLEDRRPAAKIQAQNGKADFHPVSLPVSLNIQAKMLTICEHCFLESPTHSKHFLSPLSQIDTPVPL